MAGQRPPFDRLVGAWTFEPIVDGRSMGHGTAVFEWIEDAAYLLQRSHAEWSDPEWAANAPVSNRAVIGWDDTTGTVVQLYSDSRGVFRVYHGSLGAGVWTLERRAPGFHQRFIGVFRDHGRTIDGRWESSEDGTRWRLDFPITYRRAETDEAGPVPQSKEATTTNGEDR